MKIKTVIVDDDPFMVQVIQDLCLDSPLVEVISTYTEPLKFLEEAKELDFDLALLDIQMPDIDGLRLARKLETKAVIFITGKYDLLKDALATINHVDIVTKPVQQTLLNIALETAWLRIKNSKEKNLQEFKEFTLAHKGKRLLKVNDILFVRTENGNTHHKCLFMRSGESISVTLCTMEELLNISEQLLQPNQSELISKEIISDTENDEINVAKEFQKMLGAETIKISRTYHKSFMENILYAAR
jgi:two-component system LytT family response regulator